MHTFMYKLIPNALELFCLDLSGAMTAGGPLNLGKEKEGNRLREDGINKSLVKMAGICGSRRSHRVFRLL